MKIIVCTKQLRHTYARTGKSPESNYISPEDNIFRVNPYDEAALELALRLKDANADVEVVLLTMGPMVAQAEMQRCLATGADGLVQIPLGSREDPLDQPDPRTKADLLAKAITELEGQLVLCGKASLDKGSGQVGALLAHRLNLPFVSAITDINLNVADGQLQVQRSAGRGVREIIVCQSPAVFSVDLGPELRLPKFSRRQWVDAYTPRQLEIGAGPGAPGMVCTHRFQPRPRPKIVPPPDSRLHAYERVLQLLTGSKVEKKGEMLTGDPASQVDGIIAFLGANGFLESENPES